MQNPLVYLINRMWHYSKGNRRNVVKYAILSAMATLVGALDPIIVGIFLNSVQTDGINAGTLPRLILLLCLLPLFEILFWVFHGPSRVLESSNAFFVRSNYKNYLLIGTMNLPIEWHTDHHSGNIIDKIEKGTQALHSYAGTTFQEIHHGISLLVAFGVMLFFDLKAGGVAIIISFIAFYVLTRFDEHLIPGYREVNRAENKTSAKIFDALSNVTTVIILRVESLVIKSIDVFIQKPYKRYNKNAKIGEWKWFSAAILGKIIVVIVVIIYIFSNLKGGALMAGTIYILYGYADRIQGTFFKFASRYNDIVKYRAAVTNTEELSDDFMKVDGNKKSKLNKDWSEIEINNLSFSYGSEENTELHLTNISFKIKKGERIALIGESGGGKSTLLKVIRDLYHTKTLEVMVDGKVAKKGFNDFSDSISLIPQDPEIFATTIRENITLGVEHTDEYIKKFTEIARFADIVERLPYGLDSSIVEKGVNLSGGERQRLALSRGLLASENKEIILLDEPTSSVDFHNELEIYKSIFEAFKGKTIISSIHRLHLLSLFDCIYLLKNGKIVASGNFEDLKQNSKDFGVLWKKYIKTRDA